MQKNKGITLVALVVTIIILLILAGVTISMITGEKGLFGKANEAAGKYNQAVKNEADLINQLLNGNYTFGGNEETPIEPVPDLIKDSNMDFIYKPDTWTNGTVNVEITTSITGYTLQYSLDNGTSWNNYTEEIPVTTNGKVILARLAEGERTGGIATGQVENIDTQAPKSFNLTATAEETSITVSVDGIVEDADETATSGKSGIRGYQFKLMNSDGTTKVDWTTEQTEPNYIFNEGITAGTTYKVSILVIDNAGTPKEATNKNISVTTLEPVPDLIKDSNMDFIYKPGTWTNGTVNVEITTSITGYTLQYSLDNGTSWNNYTEEIPVTTNGKVILARLADGERTGGIATGQVENIDTQGPKAFNLTATAEETSITVSAEGTVEDADETETSGKSGIRGYQFKLMNSDGTTKVDWTTEQNEPSYTFNTGITAETTYKISMKAIDNAGTPTEATNNNKSITTKITYSTYVSASSKTIGNAYQVAIQGSTSRSVWGSDIYTADSNIAKAAVHAGIVAVGESKIVTIEVLAGQSSYTSTTRNGITTSSYGSYSKSYKFITNYNTYVSASSKTIGNTYQVAIQGTTSGSVWGSDIYTADSNIAKAAVHAGIIAVGESKIVTIEVMEGQSSYTSTTRNGITTYSYGSYSKSYKFVK